MSDKIKKAAGVIIVLLMIAGAVCFLLFRPSTVNEDVLKDIYRQNKDSFAVMADYLTKYKVSAEIDGLISVDNDYGVPSAGSDEFKKFNEALQKVMAGDCVKVVSDGKTVKFFAEDKGGILSRQDGYVLYSQTGSGTSLGGKDWYACIEKR